MPRIEKRINEIESGKMRMPVWSASRPRVICRYTGIMKKRPAVIAYCARSTVRPLRRRRIRNRVTSTRGGRSFATRWRWRTTNAQMSAAPASTNQVVIDTPKGAIGTPLTIGGCSGMTQPQVLLCSIPYTTNTRPAAESSTLNTSMRTGRAPARSVTRRENSTTTAMITTSATNTYRQLK